MLAIQEGIRWLDSHSGSAMVLLTLVYVVGTLLILIEMRRTNKISLNLETARNRPFVVFYVDSRDWGFHAILNNFGPQPAFDIRTIIEPAITRRGDPDNQLSVAKNVVPMLAPGMHIDDFIEVTHTYLQRSADVSHKVTVQYKDSLGTEYSERGIVSLEHYRNRMTSHTESAEDKMATALAGIERKLQDLARSSAQLKWAINNAFNRPSAPQEPALNHDELGPTYGLSEDELEYLSNIAHPHDRGGVYCATALGSAPEEEERFYEMTNRFLTLGLLRKELNRLVLTDRAYRFMRQRIGASSKKTGESVGDEGVSA